jgi:hypothetical protein
MKTMTMTRALGTLLALTISMPAAAWSQERVGVATTVVGPVTIMHVAASPAPLKFKDDVLLNDRVTTGDNGFARVLLGGKAIVTARERSTITITEAPGVSTIDLTSGRIAVAVDKSRMRPGELVEIKTPNAISGVRGTIVVAEVLNGISTITVLRGLVDVYRRDPATGNAIGPATPVGVRESVTVKANVLPTRPQTISVDHARNLSNDFAAPVRPVSPTNTNSVAAEVTRATDLIQSLSGGTSAAKVDTSTPGGALAPTSSLAPTSTLATTSTLTPTTTLSTTSTLLTITTIPTTSTLPTLTTTPLVSPMLTTPPPTTVPILPTNTLLNPIKR